MCAFEGLVLSRSEIVTVAIFLDFIFSPAGLALNGFDAGSAYSVWNAGGIALSVHAPMRHFCSKLAFLIKRANIETCVFYRSLSFQETCETTWTYPCARHVLRLPLSVTVTV